MGLVIGKAEPLAAAGRATVHLGYPRITDADIQRIVAALVLATQESRANSALIEDMRVRKLLRDIPYPLEVELDRNSLKQEPAPVEAAGMKWDGHSTKSDKATPPCPLCNSEPEPDGFGPHQLRKCSNRECDSYLMCEPGGEWFPPTEREKAGYLAHKGTRVFAAIQDHLAEQSKIPATLPFQGGRMVSRIDFDVSDAEVQRQINERFDLLFRMVGDLYQR